MSPGSIFGEALTLGIDTSSPCSSVCLAKGREILASAAAEELGMAEALTRLISSVCAAAHRPLAEVELVAVCIGPGSFTGLRTGISSTYGLSLALGLPLRGISAFATRVFGSMRGPGAFLVKLAASREEYFWTVLEVEQVERGLSMRTLSPPSVCRIDSFEAEISKIQGLLGSTLTRIEIDEQRSPNAGAQLAALAAQFLWGDGPDFQEPSGAGGLSPLYIKQANARTLAERGIKC